MKNILFLFILSVCLSCNTTAQVQTQAQKEVQKNSQLPRVMILATGGTIAGSGDSDTRAAYKAGEVPVEDLIQAVPEIQELAQIKGEQISNIGSQDMDIDTWLRLSARINEIYEQNLADAVVITHGTDTMEETAYFLSLTVDSNQPTVLVGAMRAATSMSSDGKRNLWDAIQVAIAPESKDKGVLVAMNEKIFDARSVEKTHTTNMEAFGAPNGGPIGVVFDGKVRYYTENLMKPPHKFDIREFGNLPRVDIVYGYVGAEPQIVDFSVKNGALGIVYAGVGNGNFSQSAQNSLSFAVENGLIVIRSTRIGAGRVTLDNEVDDEALGFVVADDLSPQKARILLMLALTQTTDRGEIQQMFFEY